MKTEFEEIFSILKTGNQEQIKAVKNRLDKLWRSDSKTFKKNAVIVLTQLTEFDTINNPTNQAAFVSALNLFFLSLSDDHFHVLKKFVLKVICHPHGHVREQMRKTADWLVISLSDRIDPFVWRKNKKLTVKEQEDQVKAKVDAQEYLSEIEMLMEACYKTEYSKADYIHELKPSIYKSLQLLYCDITRHRFVKKLHTPPAIILLQRESIEKELSIFIQKTKTDITLWEIQDIIFDETDFTTIQEIIRVFEPKTESEAITTVELVNAAWNYFPHKSLHGRCPAEMKQQVKTTKVLN